VLSPPIQRLSIPFFFNPQLSATARPIQLPHDLVWERPSARDDARWQREDNKIMASYGANAFKSLARSHPDAMRRNHSDLAVAFASGGLRSAI
jgi:isopenicillin N synthase-like dioxygenase